MYPIFKKNDKSNISKFEKVVDLREIHRILERVRSEMEMKYETTSEWLDELDPHQTGFVPTERFKELLRSICPDLVEQEIITICRRYDLDGDGQVSFLFFFFFCFVYYPII